jgi:pantoate--beta-alanine ligase
MFICTRADHLREWIQSHRRDQVSIGFVPTMGALHEGHLSLIETSHHTCTYTIVSVYVNPLQFNDPADLKKYPRPLEKDMELVLHAHGDVFFHPADQEMYPPGDQQSLSLDLGILDEVMEGAFRPGHFKGVAEVVYRLLKIVRPDQLFMGQKDFQQLAVIRKLIQDQQLNVNLVACPTVREQNGLAMSSRNTRLSVKAREEAGRIYQILNEGKTEFLNGRSVTSIKEHALQSLRKDNFYAEYFDIVDGNTLRSISDAQESPYVLACTAVRVEGIRLIDNMIWKS